MPGSQAISVYTVLILLKQMRSRLGIEAMAEFLDHYTAAVERLNPELKTLVNEALSERALANLYEAVMSHEKK